MTIADFFKLVNGSEEFTKRIPDSITGKRFDNAESALSRKENGLRAALAEDNEQANSPGRLAAENDMWYNYSAEIRGVLERLNRGENVPLEEILKAPEIAAVEAEDDGTNSSDLPNRERIHQAAYEKAMMHGSWNGTDYSGKVRQERRIDIVIGLPGSGKSSVYTNPISQQYGSRVIDTDDYRGYIPEYNGRNAGYVHREASLIRDRVLETALDNGDNIILSTIGANAEKLLREIQRYKEEGFSVYLHFNELPNQKAMGRAISRFLGPEGRYVSPRIIAEYGDKPTQTYLALTRGGISNERLGQDVRGMRGQNFSNAGSQGSGTKDPAGSDLLAGWDWYNNDVQREQPARLVESSEGLKSGNTQRPDDSAALAENDEQANSHGRLAISNTQLRAILNTEPNDQNPTSEGKTKSDLGILPFSDLEAGNLSSHKGYVNGYGSKFKQFVNNVRKIGNAARFYFGKVSGKLGAQIRAAIGLDITDFNIMMRSDEVQHALNSHGNAEKEAKRGRLPITQESILQLPDVFNNPDEIVMLPNKDYEGRDAFEIRKQLNGYVVAVVGVANGRHSIEIDSVRIINKKGTPTTVNVTQNASLDHTSETRSRQNPSNRNIPQNGANSQGESVDVSLADRGGGEEYEERSPSTVEEYRRKLEDERTRQKAGKLKAEYKRKMKVIELEDKYEENTRR